MTRWAAEEEEEAFCLLTPTPCPPPHWAGTRTARLHPQKTASPLRFPPCLLCPSPASGSVPLPPAYLSMPAFSPVCSPHPWYREKGRGGGLPLLLLQELSELCLGSPWGWPIQHPDAWRPSDWGGGINGVPGIVGWIPKFSLNYLSIICHYPSHGHQGTVWCSINLLAKTKAIKTIDRR